LRDAYRNQLSDLHTYLDSRANAWRQHQQEVENMLGIHSPSKWMENIGKELKAGLDIGWNGPNLATGLEQALASFGQMATNTLAMPMSSRATTYNTTHNHNLSVNATYTKPQSETSLRDDLMLQQMMMTRRSF
ncbi:MAG: hypothetical protein KKH61_19830, partial [Gammaproteobacteria bacterium]|nr:hypothetical protein [Gammaproteobacteria bacterium]